jgi:isoquinoline 1-oxidoreductase subunit beta
MNMIDKPLKRRKFLQLTGLSGTALALGFYFPASSKEISTGATLYNISSVPPAGIELSAFIIIDTTGKITLINPRPDMGQGSFQAIPMLLAEELEVNLDQVEIRQSDGRSKYGNQLSGGSGSVRSSWEPLRKAGAAAREMLIQAAANKWKVGIVDCYAENGKVINKKNNTSLTYGQLVEEAAKLEVPKEPKLKDPKDFKKLTKALPRPDVPLKVDGTAVFGIDVKVPGMLYASIERSPVIHGKVVKFDDSKAKAIKGVKQVLLAERPMPHKTTQSVAVIADHYWAALQGRKALNITWDEGTYNTVSTSKYFTELKELAKSEGAIYKQVGNFKDAISGAAKILEAQYETPFAAHAPMEPENAVASVKEDSCEIWAPVQAPDWLVGQVAAYLKIKPENVKVNVTFLGGAFGRKAYYDYVLEAVYLSKQVKAPVKLIWTREDDTMQGPFRPGMLSVMRGGVDQKGNVVAFEHKAVGASIQHQVFKADLKGKADEWVMECIGPEWSPYAFANASYSHVLAETEIPIVWWRSVYCSTSAFGQECFVDELAHAAGKDPMDFRIAMFEKAPRFKQVLQTLAQKSDWYTKLPAGKARGVAIVKSFESICAHAVTVSKTDEGIKVEKVVSVIDCGMTVNQDNVKAQTEGNIIMGITAAVKDPITIENGKTVQSNFHNYRVLHINEVPQMEIHIMQNQEAPGGVGEPGLPPIAPALANAVFGLTGKRIRRLPFRLDRV